MIDIKEFHNQYINTSYVKYLDYNFSDLIVSYKTIELEIANDVYDIIQYYFRFKNFTYNGHRFFGNRRDFVFFPEFIESDRQLRLVFRDELSPKQTELTISVDHFGAIRSVRYECPEYLCPHISILSDIIHQFITTSYSCLESAIISKCEHTADGICKRINMILRNHLNSVGKLKYAESVKFFIFQKGQGFFYFDKESYSKTAQHFKENQSNLYSPYELLVWLLTSPLPYSKSLSAKSFLNDGKPVWQEWDKAIFIDEVKFFESARKLYDCEPYSVLAYSESKNKKFSLSVAFKRAHKHDLVPELQHIKELIRKEFESEILKYDTIVKQVNLRKIERRINSKNPNFYGEFIGWTLSAFFRGLNYAH